MISVASIVPLVSVEVPSCPDPVVSWGIQMAAQDYFRDTELWRVEADAVITVDEAEVELDLPQGTVLNAIYNVYDAGRLLVHGRPDTVATASENWMTRTDTSIEQFWPSSPTAIRVYPINTVSASLSVYCSVIPGFSSDSFPEYGGDFIQTIRVGALWKLQSMVGKAWTNEAAAGQNAILFNAGTVRAKINSTRSGNSVMRVTMRA